MTNQSSFKVGQWLIGQSTDSKAYSYVASCSPTDKPTWHLQKMGNWKRELAKKDKNAAKKWVVTSKVKLQCNVNAVKEKLPTMGLLIKLPLERLRIGNQRT